MFVPHNSDCLCASLALKSAKVKKHSSSSGCFMLLLMSLKYGKFEVKQKNYVEIKEM